MLPLNYISYSQTKSHSKQRTMSDIGLLNEKPLHASLKNWYKKPGDLAEVSVDGFIIDLVRSHELIEIQTINFASIKRKMVKLLKNHRVRLVYPIAIEKWIVKPSDSNDRGYNRRKSLAAEPGIRRDLAQKMAYCLWKAGIISLIGKDGRANRYGRQI